MAQSKQTPRVWSDAFRGSQILSNWVKVGTSAVRLWLSIGVALGVVVGGVWFLEGTTSLDRKLWLQHVRNSVGIGERIADLPDPDGSGTRIQVPLDQVQRYTWRSYRTVGRRPQEGAFLGFLIAVGGTVTSAFFLSLLAGVEAIYAGHGASGSRELFKGQGIICSRFAYAVRALAAGEQP